MCLLIDANLAFQMFEDNTSNDFIPIIDWLTSPRKTGILVVGGLLSRELNAVTKARRFINRLGQAGRTRHFPENEINEESDKIRLLCVSNDCHVIALARLSGARLLCTHDNALHSDFKNNLIINKPKGHIYQNSDHKDLINKYGHTSACKVTN